MAVWFLLFFVLSLPRASGSPRVGLLLQGTLVFFFIFLWLYSPPRVEERLDRLLDHHATWSVCSPRGRNGADSLIPDDLVFASAPFFFFFLLSLHTKRRLGGNRVGRREGSMGWDGMDSLTPAGSALALRYKGPGAIHIYTLHWSWGSLFVGLFVLMACM